VKSPERETNSTFYCPDTVDSEAMKDGQTAKDPGKPRGWTDWPMVFTTVGGDSAPKVATTIPSLGFNRIIRVSYWLNAYNPIGSAPTAPATFASSDIYYTASPGMGPDSTGAFLGLHKLSTIRHSARLIVAADGVYMGRQSVDENGMTNSRVGFRHPRAKGRQTAANAVFADGHAESLQSSEFPNGFATTASYTTNKGNTTLARQIEINLGRATVYADPEASLAAFTQANPGAN
jgi:prepilin-type processing-associated H-X9-DG protein